MLFVRYIILSMLLVSAISCEFDENPIEGKVLVKIITEDIDTTTFWNNRSVYIIKKRDFKISDILIIDGGAVVKFDPESGTSLTVTDSGYLSCQGTITNPVVFTSLHDVKYGKEANTSSMPTAKAGNWDAINIHGVIPSSFNYCIFSYGGGGQSKSTLIVDSAYADIFNCTFYNNKGGNVDEGTGVLNLSTALPKTVLLKCKFYQNELPLSIQTEISLDTTNRFNNPENISQTNVYNAIVVHVSTKISRNVYWYEYKVPYVISGSQLEIAENVYLALGNNVSLKFMEHTKLIVPNGAFSIRNQNGAGVVFTSINDDQVKGDTRNDKSNILPAENDWSIKVIDEKDAFEWSNIFFAKEEEK